MSNTDGEDTQHLKEVLSQLELIAYEVWLDHTTSGKNLYKKFKVNDMKTAIEAARKLIQNDTTLYSQEVIDSYQEELASLREQLAKARKGMESDLQREWNKGYERGQKVMQEQLNKELKQKEDENRELAESLRKYEGREYDFRCTAPWKISDSENTWTECYNWLHSRVEVIEISVRSYVCRFLKNDVMWKLYVPYKDTKLQTVILNELSGEWLEIKNANEMKIAFKKLNLSA